MAHAHVVYLVNAPCFPSGGTYLKHLKYSQLEIYSKPGPLIFETIWHWWWLFFGVELATEENNLKWETSSVTAWVCCTHMDQDHHVWTKSATILLLHTGNAECTLLGNKNATERPSTFPSSGEDRLQTLSCHLWSLV